MKYDGKGGSKHKQRFRPAEKLEIGQKIHDTLGHQDGVVLDIARQYAHPKAPPIFSYLIRWEDGQVLAIAEAALSGQRRYQILD